MRILAADELSARLDYPSLVERIDEAFRAGVTVPVRHHHAVPVPGEAEATLLLMPAWIEGRYLGVKIATVFPGNGARGLPAVMASYVLMDGRTGETLALLDGPELTARRTAAASALASRYLSRPDASRLLVVGTGVMAPQLARAHAAVRPIRELRVWGRRREKAEALARTLAGEPAFKDCSVAAAPLLEPAVAAADIVSCATLSREPLVLGRWLRPGQHLDLVGAYTPAMRETDDEALKRARLFVDTRAGALKEGGDVVQAIASGAIDAQRVEADLFDLARGAKPGRRSRDEITLFKSTGTALEDLAAAVLAYERA